MLGITAMTIVTFMTMTSSKFTDQAFRLKKARAAFTVECDCSFWGVNTQCLANNNGAQCAADGTGQCQTGNSNCGDKPQT